MSKSGSRPKGRPPPSQQREALLQWIDKEPMLKIADTYFVISTKWLDQWKEYVHFADEAKSPSPSSAKSSPSPSPTSSFSSSAKEGVDDGHGEPPGPIDNTAILKDGAYKAKGNEPVIKAKATEGVDFVLLPHKAWGYLHKWYGGGPELPREVIGDGKEGRSLRVEVFPLALTCKNTNVEGQINPFSAIEVVVSKKATVGYLKSTVCRKMELDSAHTRVWNYAKTTGKLIQEENVTLEEAKLVDGQSLLIEVRLDDGSWPRDGRAKKKRPGSVKEKLIESRRGSAHVLSSTFNNMKSLLGIADEYQPSPRYSASGQRGSVGGGSGGGGSYYSSSGDVKAKVGSSKGVCGLLNLGNTCFLNSAIQCLSNTVALTEFFLSDSFKADINKSNPLGMKGQLADCYGALLKRVWSGDYSAVAPRNLKRCIGKYAPQFNGFSQHDAQEFLAFLLDGLHEDLNRVLDKPYVEIKESDGRADEEVSKEAWESHLKRNRSVIVDLFQGQLKSTVMCPESKCGKVSITFDPFMYISLPMPPESNRLVDIILIPSDPLKRPVMYSIKCAKSARVQYLKEKLEEYSGLSRRRISMVDIEDHYVHGFVPEARSVATFRTNATAFAFETAGPVDPKQVLRIQVVHRRVNPAFLNSPKAADPANQRKVPRQVFGMPLVMYVSAKRTTARQLYLLIWHRLSRFMKKDITRPRGRTVSDAEAAAPAAAAVKGTGMEESGDSNGSPPHEQNTGEDGPHAAPKDIKFGPDDDKENNLSGENESDSYPRLKHHQHNHKQNEAAGDDATTSNSSSTPSPVSTNEENGGVRKAKEAQQDGGHTDTETHSSGSMSGESFVSKEKEENKESRERDTVASAPPSVDDKNSTNSAAGSPQHSKHSSSSTSTSAAGNSASSKHASAAASSSGSAESYAPFDWPPQLDFTLDWEHLPFRLSYVSQNGASCGRCSYSTTCTGCPIKPDDELVKFKQVNLPTIAIDWDPKLLRDFLSDIEDHESVANNKKQSKTRLCLDDCFKLFCMNEQLGENDQWYCPKCKDFRQARKQFELWKMPQILVIHLKRFQYTRFSRDKIITFCDFPLTGLDLSEYVQGATSSTIYDLYAVANHQGGLGGGHYTAFGLNCRDNKWYHFNDGSTTPVSEDAVRTSAAYVLFYKRREGNQPIAKKSSGSSKRNKDGGDDVKIAADVSGSSSGEMVREGKGKEVEGKENSGNDKRKKSDKNEKDEKNEKNEKNARVKNENDNAEPKRKHKAKTKEAEENGIVVGGKEKNASRTVSVEVVAVAEEKSTTTENSSGERKKREKEGTHRSTSNGVDTASNGTTPAMNGVNGERKEEETKKETKSLDSSSSSSHSSRSKTSKTKDEKKKKKAKDDEDKKKDKKERKGKKERDNGSAARKEKVAT